MDRRAFRVFVLSGREGLILIPSPNILLEFSPYQLFKNEFSPTDYHWSYKDFDEKIVDTQYVCEMNNPDEETEDVNLMTFDSKFASEIKVYPGSQLIYTADPANNRLIIESVDGRSPGYYKPKLGSNYPTRYIPLSTWGFTSMRAFELVKAPLGFGQINYLVGPGESGKTSILLEIWESLLRLTKRMPNLYVVLLVIGEREKDSFLYHKIKQLVDHDKEKVEFYSSAIVKNENKFLKDLSKEDQDQWRIFDYVTMQRIRALSQKWDCIFICDSLHRAGAAFNFSGYADESSGLMSGGVRTDSMNLPTKMISVGVGSYNDQTSLTTISALIGNYGRYNGNNSNIWAKMSEGTWDHVPDSRYVLFPGATQYPKIDISENKTGTRRQQQFIPQRLMSEQIAVDKLMWDRDEDGVARNNAAQALEILLNYTRSKPIPPWIEKPPEEPIIPAHIKIMRGDNVEIEKRLAYLSDPETYQKVYKAFKSTGLDRKKIISNAIELYTRCINDVPKNLNFYLASKPGDEVARIDLVPHVLLKSLK